MSELSIFEKSQEIRFETEIYANTCERVADVLDDINTTKANKSDVASAIQVVVDEMTQMEQEIYDYVDDEVGALETEVAKKMTKPAWEGYEQQYMVISSNTPNNLRPITIGAYRIPVWTGNTFYSSPFYMTVDQTKLGLNVASPTEALDVLGNVRANAFRFISTSGAITVPNTLYSNGVNVIYTGADGVPLSLAFDKQVIKPISSDTILDDSYHNCIIRITATCNIYIPNTLREGFNAVCDSIGGATGTFIESGTSTFSAPFGKILKDNAMCTIYKYSATAFRLNGGLLPA